jgi:hypothetical protein
MLDFDPEHEELLLHTLALERVVEGETRRVDQLAPERFTLLRREGGLEAQLFDGTHTLVAWLDDVRKGDRLELAYTVRGANPIFDGHVMDGFQLSWPIALARWRHRLLWPEERPLFHRGQGVGHAQPSEPALVRHEGWREVVWEGSDAPAVPIEDALPPGFDAWAWVQISDSTRRNPSEIKA